MDESLQQDEARQPLPPVPGAPAFNRAIAIPMLLLTILFGVGGGVLLAIAGLAALMGEPAFVYETGTGQTRWVMLGGWTMTTAAGVICCILASIQNRLRRRLSSSV